VVWWSEFLASRGSGFVSGITRFSEKWWVWNGIHTAGSVRFVESRLARHPFIPLTTWQSSPSVFESWCNRPMNGHLVLPQPQGFKKATERRELCATSEHRLRVCGGPNPKLHLAKQRHLGFARERDPYRLFAVPVGASMRILKLQLSM
jgi:hypothetical protein